MSKTTHRAGLVAEFPAGQGTDGDKNISAGKKVLNEHLRFFLIFHERGEGVGIAQLSNFWDSPVAWNYLPKKLCFLALISLTWSFLSV